MPPPPRGLEMGPCRSIHTTERGRTRPPPARGLPEICPFHTFQDATAPPFLKSCVANSLYLCPWVKPTLGRTFRGRAKVQVEVGGVCLGVCVPIRLKAALTSSLKLLRLHPAGQGTILGQNLFAESDQDDHFFPECSITISVTAQWR